MPALTSVFHTLRRQIRRVSASRVRPCSQERLALLVTGVVLAEHSGLARIAQALADAGLTGTEEPARIERRLRRTLNDADLTTACCYEPLLGEVVDWAALARDPRGAVLIVDESSKADQIHLLRVSLAYRGSSLPLVWTVWEQNEPMPEGAYWRQLDLLLARLAALLPAGLRVTLLADRAYEAPHFLDLVSRRGWHWQVRCTLKGELRCQDALGREHRVRDLVARHVARPGQRWRMRGQFFKAAGWRAASLVVYWAPGQREALGVLTDEAPTWTVLAGYSRRFWIEPGFRNDKAAGWHWEQSQVRGVAHHARLLLALAWATALALCLGAQEVPAMLAKATQRAHRPTHARASLFTLGVRHLRRCGRRHTAPLVRWWLPDPAASSWNAAFRAAQAARFLFPPLPRRTPLPDAPLPPDWRFRRVPSFPDAA
jgi:hypothetical protein